MTDTDHQLRDRLRWTIHGLFLLGFGLILLLLTVAVVTPGFGSGNGTNQAQFLPWVLLGIWGFFAIYAIGTSAMIWMVGTNWLRALLIHVGTIVAIPVAGGLVILIAMTWMK